MKQLIVNIPDGLRYATIHVRIDGEKVVPNTKEEVQADVFLDIVLRYHEIDEMNLKIHDRHQQMVRARQQLCLLLKENTKLTLNQIGKIIKRDHATVLNSCRTAINRIETKDYPFYKEWRELNEMIKYNEIHN